MITQESRLLFERIRRRLDRWELGHLRGHAASLAVRVERQRRLIESLKRRLSYAEESASNAWHMLDVERMLAYEREENPHRQVVIRISQDGHVGLVERPVEWHPC